MITITTGIGKHTKNYKQKQSQHNNAPLKIKTTGEELRKKTE
jgi:hypothetical protein